MVTASAHPEPSSLTNRTAVIGVGASADGLKALLDFFEALPPDPGIRLVTIHLDPEHEATLSALFQAKARMPATRVRDRAAIEPDHIYLIPPNKRLGTTLQTLSISDFGEEDILLNEKLNQRVFDQAEQVNRLVASLSTEQNERTRIAELLHDHIQQLLFGGRMTVQRLLRRWAKDRAPHPDMHDLGQLNTIIAEIMDALRGVTVDLSLPALDDENLVSIVVVIARRMQELYGLQVDVKAESACLVPRKALRILLTQIIRELLFNVVKHAEVDHATVQLHTADSMMIINIEDGGKGFAPNSIAEMYREHGGIGLYSTHKRLNLLGGRLELDSAPGEGTRIKIVVPQESNRWPGSPPEDQGSQADSQPA